MKYFRTPSGDIRAIEICQELLIESDWTEITGSDLELVLNPQPVPEEKRKVAMLAGVEFEGVMCSAHKEDQWGLDSIKSWIESGQTVSFEFKNGNKLLLSSDNLAAFEAVWIPFRASFFA